MRGGQVRTYAAKIRRCRPACVLAAVLCVSCTFDLAPLEEQTSAGIGGGGGSGGGQDTGGSAPLGGGGTSAAGTSSTAGGLPPDDTIEYDADGRRLTDLTVLYTFPEAGASFGVYPEETAGAFDLQLAAGDPSALTALAPHGIQISEPGTALLSVGAASSALSPCQTNSELSVEMWLSPERSNPGALLMLADREDPSQLSFAVMQTDGNVRYELRLATSMDTAATAFVTPEVARELVHLVFVHHENGMETVHMNGELAATNMRPGDFSSWSSSHVFAVGADAVVAQKWFGQLFRAAIYCAALSETDIEALFAAGH